jgi:O-antigen/teichoic acid export membrane protein
VVAVLAVIAAGAGLPWLVMASGVGMPLGALLNFAYLAKRDSPQLRPKWARVSAVSLRRLLRSSIPLFLFQFGALLVNYTQPFLLARVANYRVVADYSLLLRLYSLAGTVIVLSTSSFFPAFREAFERGDRGWVRSNFARMLGLRMGLALVLGSVLAVAGNPMLRLWLGRDAVDFPVTVWLLLVVVLVVSAWGTAFSDLLTVMDDLWIQVAVVLLNGAATVALTLWLAPRWGIPGALAAIVFVPLLVWSWAGPAYSRSLLRCPEGAPATAGEPGSRGG